MWELLTQQCPYGEMSAIQIALKVLNEDIRPEIPTSGVAPPSYVEVMQGCWIRSPDARPSFSDVLFKLEAMKPDPSRML